MAHQVGSNSVLERTFSRNGDEQKSSWSYYGPAIILLILGGPSLALWAAPYMPWLFWTSLGILGASLFAFLFLRRPWSIPVGLLAVAAAAVFLGCFNAKYDTPFFSIAFLALAGLALLLAIAFHIRNLVRQRKTANTPPEEQLEAVKPEDHKVWAENAV